MARYHTHDVRCLCLAGRFPAAAPTEPTMLPPTDPSHPRARRAAQEARPLRLADMRPAVVSGPPPLPTVGPTRVPTVHSCSLSGGPHFVGEHARVVHDHAAALRVWPRRVPKHLSAAAN